MPIDASPAGTLDIENATLRSREIVALTNMVAGNDVVRSGGPALEVYGDPSHGGNEARLELVSNTAAVSSAFTRLTSNAGVFSVKTGTDASDNGTITFGGFSNERLRITSDGKVGVGTDAPTRALEIARGGGSAIINLKRTDTGTGQGALAFLNSLSNTVSSISASRFGAEGGELIFRTAPNDTTETSDNPYLIPERMRIDADGNVGIGTNNPLYKLQVTGTGCLSGIWANPANEADSRHWITSAQHDITPTEFTNSTADGRLNIQDKASVFIRFILGTPNTSENLKGAITQSGSNTLYTATSDYRLKTNIKPFTNGLEIINSLKPVYYTFNVEPYDDCSGFIAHELQEIIPQCVAGKKDEVDKHGNMIPQSVDKSYIVTHLVSALQQVHKELQTEKTRNDTLETQLTSVLARLDALESA